MTIGSTASTGRTSFPSKAGQAVAAGGPPPARRGWRLGPLDFLLLALVAALLAFAGWRVAAELHYRWNWSVVWTYLIRVRDGDWSPGLLLEGLFATLRLAVLGIVASTVLGVGLGLARTARRPFARLSARAYIELVRNMPPLVFIFILYFFVASRLIDALGIPAWARSLDPGTAAVVEVFLGPPSLIGNFASGLLCLILIETAYVAEIVRAGLLSVERGQWEAASSLGLTRWRSLRLVVLPQALRRVLPALAGQLIQLVKASSIVSLISVQELTFSGAQVASSTRQFFEIWLAVAIIYFVLCFILSIGTRALERRLEAAPR